jgi:hypothetical protein
MRIEALSDIGHNGYGGSPGLIAKAKVPMKSLIPGKLIDDFAQLPRRLPSLNIFKPAYPHYRSTLNLERQTPNHHQPRTSNPEPRTVSEDHWCQSENLAARMR